MPARRRIIDVPKGLKPVRRKLATGEVRVYWYHRATGKRLESDPRTAAGLLEVQALDARAKALESAQEAATGTLAHLWAVYTRSPEWTALKPRTRSDYQKVYDWIGAGAERANVRRIDTAKIVALGDIEAAHVEADGVLRKLLIALGYEDVVAEYDKIDKWYA